MKLKKLVALGTVMTLFVSPMAVFADTQTVDTDKQIMDTKIVAPGSMDQRVLTKRDLEAIEYAKSMLKDYFNYEPNKDKLIMDVYYSSDYSDEEYSKGKNYRENVSVSFMPKDDNVVGGAYISYYEDNKEIVSASITNIDYEAKRKISKEKGKEIADKFLKEKTKLDLSGFKYKAYDEGPYNQDFVISDYYYQRIEKGVEFDADYASASVDLSTGEVVSFYKNFSKGITFPDIKPDLTANEALDIVKDKFSTQLRYVTSLTDEKRVIPVYSIDTSYCEAVDAHTKQLYSFGGPIKIEKINKTKEQVEALVKDITPVEINAQNKGQAVEVANNLMKAIYGVELTPILEENGGDPNYLYVSYKDNKAKMEYFVSMEIPDKKALFINKSPMYIEGMEDGYYQADQKPVISYKEAYDIAIKELAKIAPEEMKAVDFEQVNYIYEPNQDNQIEYYFNFPRKVEGVVFQEEYLDVRVNAVTKSVESMSVFWDKTKTFDSIKNVIKPEDAVSKFISDKTMELRYTMDYTETQKTGNPVIKLIYSMVAKDGDYKGNFIDAKTGKYIEYPMVEPVLVP